MVFVWKTNFDAADKTLGIVPPSTEKQTNNVVAESKSSKGTPAKSKSILKEQDQVQNHMASLSLNENGNKENDPIKEGQRTSKVT